MRIVEPKFEIIETSGDKLRHIERIARICYKSEDKISESSTEPFIKGIIKRGHESVLEHSDFLFEIDRIGYLSMSSFVTYLANRHNFNSFLRFTSHAQKYLISGNVRAWRDLFRAVDDINAKLPSSFYQQMVVSNPILFSEWLDGNIFYDAAVSVKIVDPSTLDNWIDKVVHQTATVIFTCDRGISHEIVRHRTASFSQESTRYCNYLKGKFGSTITVIKPIFLQEGTNDWRAWERSCKMAEDAYFDMLDSGCMPQEARSVLPNSLKTEIAMTGNLLCFHNFFKLRTAPEAHPQMKELAIPLYNEFVSRYPNIRLW